ncbi:MAG: TRAP transporter large permease [Alphaproteobacteria bacterium]|nr:TRAP transporter large permease [Alphaproteobacteria bacterium]
MLLIVLIIAVIVFSLIGMEIAWAIAMACLAFIFLSQLGLWEREIPLVLFAQSMREGLNSFILLAIPLFVFAGELMNASGVTQRIVRVASVLVAHRSGGLANVGVTANFIMSGISGSALADAAATGTVLVPEMTKRGFPPAFSSAVIASAATVGPIIPPSLVFVLLGAIVEVSVGKLFLAGIVPGTVMFIAMFITTWWICRARGYPVEPRATRAERVSAALDGALALLAPVIIVGSIVGGVTTATEGAAVAVAYTMILGVFVYRTLTVRAVIEAAGATAIASAVIMLTVATSQIFAWLAVQARMGEILTAWMLAISDNVWVLLALANVLMLILGTFMELLPIMLVLAPILFPMFAKMGIDPVHFGVVMVLNLMIGMITPPIGLNLFVLSAISKQGVIEIFREAIPYFVALVIVLALITYVPVLTLFVPGILMPK